MGYTHSTYHTNYSPYCISEGLVRLGFDQEPRHARFQSEWWLYGFSLSPRTCFLWSPLVGQSHMTFWYEARDATPGNAKFPLELVLFICYSLTFIHDVVIRIENSYETWLKPREALVHFLPRNESELICRQEISLQWRLNERDGISNHQPHDYLLNRLYRRRSKKTSKLRVTGLSVGILPVGGEFPTERASNATNVSIWWRHHIYVAVCLWMGLAQNIQNLAS